MRWLGTGVAVAAAGYAAYAGATWLRYGHVKAPARRRDEEPLLDLFMPEYETAERHRLRVAAPAKITFASACAADIQQSPVIRSLFMAREVFLSGTAKENGAPALGLADQAKAWGWGVLAENPGREIVFGAVTQPWLASPVFRALPPGEFAAFREPGFVKIAWTLRADPIDARNSMVRTETRVATTDSAARAKFRRYWALASPGIILIRWVALSQVKAEAERSARSPGSERTGNLCQNL